MNYLNDIPNEMYGEILSHLKIKDICRLGITNTINNNNTTDIISEFINKYVTWLTSICLSSLNTPIVLVAMEYQDFYRELYEESGIRRNYGKQYLLEIFRLYRLPPSQLYITDIIKYPFIKLTVKQFNKKYQ